MRQFKLLFFKPAFAINIIRINMFKEYESILLCVGVYHENLSHPHFRPIYKINI